jgi:hypothetical protein
MGIGILIGALLALAGMGDPGPPASAPAYVQLAPLSGLIVVGALLEGIRTMRRLDSASQRDGAKLLGIALIVIAMAVWVALAAPPARGLATGLAVIAFPPFAVGCVLIQPTSRAG